MRDDADGAKAIAMTIPIRNGQIKDFSSGESF